MLTPGVGLEPRNASLAGVEMSQSPTIPFLSVKSGISNYLASESSEKNAISHFEKTLYLSGTFHCYLFSLEIWWGQGNSAP